MNAQEENMLRATQMGSHTPLCAGAKLGSTSSGRSATDLDLAPWPSMRLWILNPLACMDAPQISDVAVSNFSNGQGQAAEVRLLLGIRWKAMHQVHLHGRLLRPRKVCWPERALGGDAARYTLRVLYGYER